jgi:hypothetical protein
MKTLKICLFLCGILFASFSCTKEKANSQNSPLSTSFLNDFGKCFLFIDIKTGYVINDDSSYQSIGESNKNIYSADCTPIILPAIDFNSYTLLGIQTGMSECDSLIREVTVDTSSKKYIYEINIKRYRETCSQILKLSMNWVLVPKLPSEYKVDFNVIVNN